MDWGGGEWFAFVMMAGISTGHKFSRGLFGTRVVLTENLQKIFCLKTVRTMQLILTADLTEFHFC